METIFMNSENSKISEPYVLILKLTDKFDLRNVEKSVFIKDGKTQKGHTIRINLKYHLQHGMINLNYQMGHTLY